MFGDDSVITKIVMAVIAALAIVGFVLSVILFTKEEARKSGASGAPGALQPGTWVVTVTPGTSGASGMYGTAFFSEKFTNQNGNLVRGLSGSVYFNGCGNVLDPLSWSVAQTAKNTFTLSRVESSTNNGNMTQSLDTVKMVVLSPVHAHLEVGSGNYFDMWKCDNCVLPSLGQK